MGETHYMHVECAVCNYQLRDTHVYCIFQRQKLLCNLFKAAIHGVPPVL